MARIVNFVDGAESETTPTIGNITASNLVQYVDDAAYEAAELGAPAEGNIYYNTTLNQIRYYNGTAWITLADVSTAQTFTNKSIDADANTVTNIDNDNIKAAAAIDATKIHDGSVDNTEFGYLNGVTSGIQGQIDGKIDSSEKGAVNGVATLDGSGLVPSSQLPSYVDDVLEFANLASFPVTGETGKIYVALDTNLTYRWTGSIYVQISSGVDQLSDLTDVDTAGVSDGQALIYNSGAGEWQPGDAATIAQENISLIGKGTASWNINVSGFTNSQSLILDGVDEYLTTGGAPSAELGSNITNTLSAFAYIKTTAAGGNQYVMGQWNADTSNAKWALGLTGAGEIIFVYSQNGSTPFTTTTSGQTLNDGNWNHIGVVYDGAGSSLKLYADGVEVANVTPAVSSLFNTTFDFRLGSIINASGTNFVWNGYIDEPVVFNAVLNGAQVTELYNGGAAFDLDTHSASASKAGWWHIDGDTFPTITDNEGFNNLTMTNMEAGDIISDSPPGSAGTTKQLILDSNCYISVPPLADDRHRILPQSINIDDGECAYITLDRSASVATDRTVSVAPITSVVPDNDKLIIARNVGDECYFGIHDPQKLKDGESLDIQRGFGPVETLTLVDAFRTTTLSSNASNRVQITGLSENIDLKGEMSGSAFTAASSGYYLLEVYFESDTFDALVDIEYDVNNSGSYVRLARASGVGAEGNSDGRSGQLPVFLNAGDVVRFYLWGNALVRDMDLFRLKITRIPTTAGVGVSEAPTFTTTLLQDSVTSFTTYTGGINSWVAIAQVDLPDGEWDLEARVAWFSNGGTTTSELGIAITDNAGTGNPGNHAIDKIFTEMNQTNGDFTDSHFSKRGVVVSGGPTTWYLRTYVGGSNTNVQYACLLTARKVSS